MKLTSQYFRRYKPVYRKISKLYPLLILIGFVFTGWFSYHVSKLNDRIVDLESQNVILNSQVMTNSNNISSTADITKLRIQNDLNKNTEEQVDQSEAYYAIRELTEKLAMDSAEPKDYRSALIAVMSICESTPEQEVGVYPVYPAQPQPMVNDTDKASP